MINDGNWRWLVAQLVLTSMHKYVPRVHVIAASDYANLHWGLPMTINTSAFQVCSFIAVTAYAVRAVSFIVSDWSCVGLVECRVVS